MQTFFGVGLTPAQAIRKTADMGYIQNFWMLGVIGFLMLYYFYINPIKLWGKYIRPERILALAIGAVMAAFLIKLNLFGYGISTVVIMTVFIGRLATLTEYSSEYNSITDS